MNLIICVYIDMLKYYNLYMNLNLVYFSFYLVVWFYMGSNCLELVLVIEIMFLFLVVGYSVEIFFVLVWYLVDLDIF